MSNLEFRTVVKFIVALVGAGLIAVQTGLTDGGLSTQDWVSIGIAVITALGVYALPNAETQAGNGPANEGDNNGN
jgi:uncharacterized membrane protein YcjF (UPF0283 family)